MGVSFVGVALAAEKAAKYLLSEIAKNKKGFEPMGTVWDIPRAEHGEKLAMFIGPVPVGIDIQEFSEKFMAAIGAAYGLKDNDGEITVFDAPPSNLV